MHINYLLVNDKDLTIRAVKVYQLHSELIINQSSLKKKKITYEEYRSYKNPYWPEIFCKAIEPYFLMVGEYRIALVLRMHTVNGWETCFFGPCCEDAMKCFEFPAEYIKASPFFDDYAFVSLLEDLDHYLDEKNEC